MKFTIQREDLLPALQRVVGIVERRQSAERPILSHILLSVRAQQLVLTGTDQEMEIIARVELDPSAEPGEVTVPAKKFLDICRALPADSEILLAQEELQVVLKSGRSRFRLSGLSPEEFPNLEDGPGVLEVSLAQAPLRQILEATQFAMALQDVRTFLNGMLFEFFDDTLRVVATDGHRLALNEMRLPQAVAEPLQIILPRRSVLELLKILADVDADLSMTLGDRHVRIMTANFTYTAKLLDGKFPDYHRVIPALGDKQLVLDSDSLKQALTSTAVLCNEKMRSVRLQLEAGLLRLSGTNPEQEEAVNELALEYQSEALDIGFNVQYLLDILGAVGSEKVRLFFTNNTTALLVKPEEETTVGQYVVMPVRF